MEACHGCAYSRLSQGPVEVGRATLCDWLDGDGGAGLVGSCVHRDIGGDKVDGLNARQLVVDSKRVCVVKSIYKGIYVALGAQVLYARR